MQALSEAEISERLLAFIRDTILSGDPHGELNETTPLLEWGVLDSLNTARLIAFIRQDLGTEVPLAKITARSFKDVRSITSMLVDAASGNPS